MYEDTAWHINRMKKKEDIAMQTGNLLEKTTPNYRFMTWLWHHHWRYHYSYDVKKVTRSSTNLYLYYFIMKCTFSSKYCNAARIQKIWNLYKIINFREFSGASNKIATAGLPRAAEPWRLLRICQIDINWKVAKTQPTPVYTFWNFWKSLNGGVVGGVGVVLPPLPPPPKVEIGLRNMKYDWIKSNKRNAWYVTVAMVKVIKEWVFI